MNTTHLAALRRSLTAAASRRGVLGALSGGLLAAGPLARLVDDSEARKNGKRRKKRKKQARRKNRKDQKPKTRVDARCSGPRGFSSSNDNGTARFAQTFTAIASGSLVKAELGLVKEQESNGDYVLRLSLVDGDGVPTNDVLAETTVANADVPEGSPTVPFTFADPFTVEGGEEYALVLTRPGGKVAWGGTFDDPCPGRGFASLDQTAPFIGVGVVDSDFIVTTFIKS